MPPLTSDFILRWKRRLLADQISPLTSHCRSTNPHSASWNVTSQCHLANRHSSFSPPWRHRAAQPICTLFSRWNDVTDISLTNLRSYRADMTSFCYSALPRTLTICLSRLTSLFVVGKERFPSSMPRANLNPVTRDIWTFRPSSDLTAEPALFTPQGIGLRKPKGKKLKDWMIWEQSLTRIRVDRPRTGNHNWNIW